MSCVRDHKELLACSESLCTSFTKALPHVIVADFLEQVQRCGEGLLNQKQHDLALVISDRFAVEMLRFQREGSDMRPVCHRFYLELHGWTMWRRCETL